MKPLIFAGVSRWQRLSIPKIRSNSRSLGEALGGALEGALGGALEALGIAGRQLGRLEASPSTNERLLSLAALAALVANSTWSGTRSTATKLTCGRRWARKIELVPLPLPISKTFFADPVWPTTYSSWRRWPAS